MRDSKILRIVLYILLIGCIGFYLKIFVLDNNKSSYVDLPKKITESKWYKYKDQTTLEFSVGNIKTTDSNLSKCTKYTYNKKDKSIILNCNNYKMKVLNVDKYKLILMVDHGNKSSTITYYKYKEIIDYMNEKQIEDISEEEIEENIDIPKRINDNDYRNALIAKLTVIKELAVNELKDVINGNKNSLILIINPNMKTSSYNIIPIFINWMNNNDNYSFYYINGNNINANDETLLNQFEDEKFKDYIIGLNDLNLIRVKDKEYSFINVSINTKIDHDKVFDCSDDCDDIDLTLKDGEKEILARELFK